MRALKDASSDGVVGGGWGEADGRDVWRRQIKENRNKLCYLCVVILSQSYSCSLPLTLSTCMASS